jgi:two-component system, LytTR family, sensor histidine kinase AlgZ
MATQPREHDDFLPNFCGSEATFAVLLIMQLVALLLVAGRSFDDQLWERLLLLSLYLHWIGLCSAVALCGLRRWLNRMSRPTAMVSSFLLLLLVTAAISETAWRLAQWQMQQQFLPDLSHGAFLLRNLTICAIVSTLVLRYFWLQAQWRGQVRAEGEARYQALQARIRPHFLFNSLNSIAALIAGRPREAETAVEDLAQLFRAGLSASERRIPLREELEVTRAYLRTESLRLGERLRVRWELGAGLENLPVPPLCLQPLLENAVTHGVEPLPEGGEIHVVIQKPDLRLQISVENPMPAEPRTSMGTQSALDNIRQRLTLMYGKQAELVVSQSAERFSVRLALPVTDLQALA